jgi:hypothetical protein
MTFASTDSDPSRRKGPAKDPPNMDELIEQLKDFRARAKEGDDWSDEDIVEALRQMSYDVLDGRSI